MKMMITMTVAISTLLGAHSPQLRAALFNENLKRARAALEILKEPKAQPMFSDENMKKARPM
jgi:hypothetical protein